MCDYSILYARSVIISAGITPWVVTSTWAWSIAVASASSSSSTSVACCCEASATTVMTEPENIEYE